MKLGMQIRSVMPIQDSIEIARLAEQHGYDSVWFSEGYGHNDAVSSLAAAALNTSRITLGASVMVVYLRHPVLMGMTAMGISEMASGRFALGLGTGHRDQLSRFYGLNQDRPVRYMREYVEVVRMAAAGQQAEHPGEIFDIEEYHTRTSYEHEPARLPIFLGVMNEQMLRLAGQVADGVLLAYAPKSHIPQARAWIAEGATLVGRDPSEITVAAIAPVAVSSDAAAAEDALRLRIASYCSFPDHNRMLRAGGHGRALDAVRDSLEQRDWAMVARGLSEELIAEIAVSSAPATRGASMQSYQDAGLDLLLLIPVELPNRSVAQHHADVVEAFGR